MASQTISKLEAAYRQLNTAISLWFSDGDAVSIHTLACSAYQIVDDINRSRGRGELLYDSIIFKDEYRREAINWLKQHYNFFKHADKDPSGAIEFNPVLTELFIIFTSMGLEILGVPPDEVRGAFTIYFGLRNPQCLTDKGRATFIDPIPEESRNEALAMGKREFFEAYATLRKWHTQGSRSSVLNDT